MVYLHEFAITHMSHHSSEESQKRQLARLEQGS